MWRKRHQWRNGGKAKWYEINGESGSRRKIGNQWQSA
jgi:hypothetical protein